MSTRSCPTCSSPLPDEAAYCDQCGSATHTQVIGEETSRVTGQISASYESQPAKLQKALGTQLELGRLIGRGGYAEVFQVRDHRLNRDLAIKVIRPDLVVTTGLLARFRREAMSVAALHHPAIVPVYDVGETDGICYIVMPLVRGESLKAVAQRQRRLPIDEVQRIVREAALALAAAHEANVVHRDIKPENIMLEGRERSVRLMDFGIAKAVDSSDKELTGTGVVVGTPAYMSPEQASGEPNIDHRSDQYSLAVVAYQLLSGRAPFEGETARAIIAKQLLDQPPPLDTLVDNVPPHIVAALHRAMQKRPENRFDSIKDFADALQDPGYQNPPSLEVAAAVAAAPAARGWMPWVGGLLAVSTIAAVAVSQFRKPAAGPSAPLSPAQPTAVVPPPAPSTIPVTNPPPATTLPPAATRPPDTIRVMVPQPATPKIDTTVAAVPPATCAQLAEKQDWEQAVVRCAEEGQTGNVRSAKLAALVLSEGRGNVPADQTRAAQFYELAAKGGAPDGDPEAQFWMARHAEASAPSVATDMYLAAARNRKPYDRAYPLLAARLERGLGTAVDPIAAALWYERAAAAGDLGSKLKIAEMYLAGRGVTRSDTTAQRWLQSAAADNSAEAQYRLGMLLLRGGRGIKKSDEDGIKWLRLAAAAGHQEAKKELDKRKDD